MYTIVQKLNGCILSMHLCGSYQIIPNKIRKLSKYMAEKLSEDKLKIMHLIEQDSNLSQRVLADKSGMSLGKINYCLSALVEIGYIKIKNFSNSDTKMKYAYILTPRGVREKTAITKRFIAKKKLEYDTLLSYLDEN